MKFNAIMDYDISNYPIFNKICKNINSIVPFIGAGLSAFTYPTWTQLLTKVATERVANDIAKQYILRLLNLGKYEEAATAVYNEISQTAFYDFIRSTYDKALIDPSKLKDEAVYLVPQLFNDIILTTNYDKVIEKSFHLNGKEFEYCTPARTLALHFVLRSQLLDCIIYKLHGDIFDESDNIILTRESYNRYYSDNAKPFVNDIIFSLQAKSLLFLGCSLQQDRAMSLLKSISNDATVNYAIVPCSDERKERIREELSDQNILPILYPENSHECVRILLENMLSSCQKDLKPQLLANKGSKVKEEVITVFDTKDKCIDILLSNLVDSTFTKHVVFFGGISSRLCQKDDILLINAWLKRNKNATLFICYEEDSVAKQRGLELDVASLPDDSLPKHPFERMELKTKNIISSYMLYTDDVQERIFYIPILRPLNTYMIVADDNFYFTVLTERKSLESPTFLIQNGKDGEKSKQDLLRYMKFSLKESESYAKKGYDKILTVLNSLG